jgi:hypothetical protein
MFELLLCEKVVSEDNCSGPAAACADDRVKKVPVKLLLPWWNFAPKTPVLSRDKIHVWCAENEQEPSAFVSREIAPMES